MRVFTTSLGDMVTCTSEADGLVEHVTIETPPRKSRVVPFAEIELRVRAWAQSNPRDARRFAEQHGCRQYEPDQDSPDDRTA